MQAHTHTQLFLKADLSSIDLSHLHLLRARFSNRCSRRANRACYCRKNGERERERNKEKRRKGEKKGEKKNAYSCPIHQALYPTTFVQQPSGSPSLVSSPLACRPLPLPSRRQQQHLRQCRMQKQLLQSRQNQVLLLLRTDALASVVHAHHSRRMPQAVGEALDPARPSCP